MKKLFAIVCEALLILLAFSFMTPATAEEAANRAICIARGEEASKLIKEIGIEATCMKIQYDDDMHFHWEKGWVQVIEVIEDEKATILAHPALPGAVGQNCYNTKDDNGELICQEFIRIAKTKGKGWVTYSWYGDKRDCYVLKVPDENVIVVSVLRQKGLQELE